MNEALFFLSFYFKCLILLKTAETQAKIVFFLFLKL